MTDLNPEVPPEDGESVGACPAAEWPPLSADGLRDRFGSDALSVLEFRGELTLVVPAERIVEICRSLRDDPAYAFNVCADVSAVDQMPREPRFELNYHLLSIPGGARMRVKVMLPGPDPVIESVHSVWSTTDWFEREIYDLMGIVFTNHPNLCRIELVDDWEGHPHRRDYPTGKQPVTFTPPPEGTAPGT